jgi:hypothetical protein
MDAIVTAALRKWPAVPHCYGWLALGARGDWYLRDDAAQAAGPFAQFKGSRIEHAGLRAFIERNYEADECGCWFFQNGPQRVYVELETAPRIFRLDTAGSGAQRWHIAAAGAREARYRSAWLDERGRLFLDTDVGFGLVHSLDTDIAAQAIEAGDWLPAELPFAAMPQRFGYVLRPRPPGPAAGR